MLIKNSKKIVIKLGSSTVVDDKGKFKKKWVTSLIKDIKKFRGKSDLVIVSSGAIALGQNYLKIKKKRIKLEMSQAIAAVGQIHIAGEFQKLFDKHKIKTGSSEPVEQMGLNFDTEIGAKISDDIYKVKSTQAKAWFMNTKNTIKSIKDKKSGKWAVNPKMFGKFIDQGVRIYAFTAAKLTLTYTHECISNILNAAGVRVD